MQSFTMVFLSALSWLPSSISAQMSAIEVYFNLRAEKEQLTIQKDAQYDTYHYFKDYHKELQTVCANVDSILGTEQEVQQHEQQRTRKYEPSL